MTSILCGVPVHRQRLDVDGIDTHILVGGDGPPVVLLHGPGEYAALWARVIPGLVEQHRVIAPDLPGHGATPLPAGRLDADRVLSWLAQLVERTCAGPAAMVGHLVGGAIAARFAARHPGQVSRLVLVDSYGLSWTRPSPRFAVPLLGFVAPPSPRSRDRFLGSCFYDFDGMRESMDGDFTPYGDYALEWARSSTAKPALRQLMERLTA